MRNEFTAIIERDGEGYVAYCLEISGANGQGSSKDEALKNLAEAIALILEDRREDGARGLPPDVIRETVIVQCAGAACSNTFGSRAVTSSGKGALTLCGPTRPPALLRQFHGMPWSPTCWPARFAATYRFQRLVENRISST